MAEAIITVGGETSQLERDIQRAFSKDFKLTNFDAKSFSPALGKIKGQLGEFEKSLEASNARVVAFGASAGSIYLLTDAFKSMVQSTINVEKTLADINSVINASEKDIKSFGNTIFDIANKTSQSFETAAEAALEFSRQGLGLEQTAKRTAAALMLARLSGLSAASSVEALTAAVNSFSSAGLDATQVVNKLAAVDAKYAVSSADLAEAIKRVGSSASEAGVSIDELVALVTSAQQTTARGGAVIGNSFKTIFTRLQRPKVLEDLQELGIQTTTAAGETLPLIQILTQLARTYDTLGSAQKSQIGELVGGVYQINILKAVLGDLSKGYSTFSGALRTSSGATNEAESRINKLGETLDSQINRVSNNLKRAGSVIGELTIAPALEKVLSNVNAVLETFALGKEPESIGEKAATGFLKGLGTFISGPGLIIAAAGAYKIFTRLASFIGDAGKTVLGLGQAAQQQAQIQAQILQLLQKNPQVYSQIESGAISVQSAAQGYLNIVNATNAALERQKAVAAQVAGAAMSGGGAVQIPASSGGGRGGKRGRAAGYAPSISSQKKMEENDARNLGAPSGVRAHFGKGTIGGKKFLMNNHEIEIPGYGANGDSAVIPKYAAGTPIKDAIKSKIGKGLKNLYDLNNPVDTYEAPYNAGDPKSLIRRISLPKTSDEYDAEAQLKINQALGRDKEGNPIKGKSRVNIASLKYRGIKLSGYLSSKFDPDTLTNTNKESRRGNLNNIKGALAEIDTFKALNKKTPGLSPLSPKKLSNAYAIDFNTNTGALYETKSNKKFVQDDVIIAKALTYVGKKAVDNGASYKDNSKEPDNVALPPLTVFQSKGLASGYIPRFAAGDGSMSIKDYMIMKYGQVKNTSELGGAALNAAYDKGVSLEELRGAAPKWADWTPKGATAAINEGRQEAKKRTQINRAAKYGYRKIILPWNKSVADFGGDPNKFGDAYEDFVAQKFGAKRGGRFKRANDYPGIVGATPESKYNYTDVDFIVPKKAGDLSQGGSLIEARGGDKKNYNASEIAGKFGRFFEHNPSYDSKKWKKILISRNAKGYIPSFAKGTGKRAKKPFNDKVGLADKVGLDDYEQIQAEYELDRPSVTADMLEPASTTTRPKSYSAPKGGRSMPSGLAPKSTAFKRDATSFRHKFYKPAAPVGESLATKQTGYKSTFFTGGQSLAVDPAAPKVEDPAVSKALKRRERTKNKPTKPLNSPRASGGGSSNKTSGKGKKSGKGGIFGSLGGSKGGMSGGMGGGMKGYLASMAVSTLANSGGLSEESSMALNKGVEIYQKYQSFQMLKEMFSGTDSIPDKAAQAASKKTGKAGAGKAGKTAAGKAGKSVSGKAGQAAASKAGKAAATKVGKATAKKVGMNIAKKFGVKALTKLGAGLIGGPVGEAIAIASIVGDIVGEGSMYFASGGGNDERKAQKEMEKEVAKYKSEGGKSLAGYKVERGAGMGAGAFGQGTGDSVNHKFGAFSLGGGAGKEAFSFDGIDLGKTGNSLFGQTEDLQRFGMEGRDSAVSGALEGLGGIKNAKSIVDKFGGVGVKGQGSKGKLDNITEEVFNKLKMSGKETGGIEFDKKKFEELQTRNNQAEAGLPGVKALNDEEKKLLETYKTAKDVAAGLVKEVAGFERAAAAQKAFSAIAKQMGEMQAKGTSMLTVYKQITASEEQRKKGLANNLGGGVDAFLDPTKSADSMSKIQRSLQTLNDPRLAGNAVERGRAANAYMAGTTEMGIDINPTTRGNLSRVQDQGLQTFQTQNFNTLNRMGAGFKNNYGLSQGINQGIYNAGEAARKNGMSIQESQFTKDAGSVQGGYLASIQGKALGLSPETVKGMEDASRKLQESIEKFAKVAEAYAGGKISEADFNRIQSSVQGAIKSGSTSTSPNAGAEVATAIEKAFTSLDAATKAIIDTKSTPSSVTIGGEVGLTKEAQEYLIIAKNFAKMEADQAKNPNTPPSGTNTKRTNFDGARGQPYKQ